MAALRNDRYLDALAGQSALFAEALAGADLRQRVPTCPCWTIYELAQHVGRAHRWATAIVIRPASTPPEPTLGVAAPEDPDELRSWLRDGAGELADASRATGPQTPCGAGATTTVPGSGLVE